MSNKAMQWATYEASGQFGLDAVEFKLLLIIADNVGIDGTGFGYSREWIVKKWGKHPITGKPLISTRTVASKLKSLREKGAIRYGDQRILSYLPANRRPKVYDLCMREPDATDWHDESTPEDSEPEPAPAETHRHAKSAPQNTEETTLACNRGATGVQQGCNRGEHCLHTTTFKPLDYVRPSESTRAKNQNPERSFDERTRLLLELKPTSEHRALADEGGLDVDWELGKFRDQALGAGKPPYDPVRAFSKWLKTGREKRIGRPPAAANGSVDGELERRARKLVESSTPLKRRQPDGDARLAWVPAIARLLGRGCDPVSIVNMIASGDADTLAEHGITVDDLGAIA